MSTDVLGRIVEIASGMTFDLVGQRQLGQLGDHLRERLTIIIDISVVISLLQRRAGGEEFVGQRFIDERIAKPLKMTATGFFVSEAQAKNVAQRQADPATGAKAVPNCASALTKKPKWLSGGGGMVSPADDYASFAQMLLNGGELDNVRLLSPKTVALMTADALPLRYQLRRALRAHDAARSPADAGRGQRLRPGVRRPQGCRRQPDARIRRRFLVDRHPWHLFLGRPKGEAGRDADGPEFVRCERVSGERPTAPRNALFGLSGDWSARYKVATIGSSTK